MKIISSEEGNKLIKSKLDNKECFIATKLGAVEQSIIIAKLNGDYNPIRNFASNNAGITPNDDRTLNFFFDEYTKSVSNSDIIGSMGLPNERFIVSKYAPNSIFSELRFLEPFYFQEPWSESIEGLNVLVIHPFEESIRKQYTNKEKIFNNLKILPNFNLFTIKAEQTNGGGKVGNKSFIDSLNYMKEKINKINFDVCLIGCGAYGLLLANHVKNMNKPAIHIGGGLQILFGIKGRRWDVHPEISQLYNEFWSRPMENEKTLNINLVEGGTYW